MVKVYSTTGIPNFNERKPSLLQFYCYLLQGMRTSLKYFHQFHALLSPFIADMYTKTKTNRLVYIRTNQNQLRAENYIYLRNAMQQDNNEKNLNSLVILPSTSTSALRYRHETTQGSFCFVRKYENTHSQRMSSGIKPLMSFLRGIHQTIGFIS